MIEEKKIEIFEKMSPKKAIIKMSLPIVLGMLIQILYNMVDIYFIGKTNDPNQVAAANLATPIFMFIMVLSSMIATGSASNISREIGAKNLKNSNIIAGNSILLGLIVSLVFTLVSLTFLGELVIRLGVNNEQVYVFTKSYVKTLIMGNVFFT